jgi:hypothetical protein
MGKDTALKLQKHSDFSFWNTDRRFEIEGLGDCVLVLQRA